MKGLKKVWLFAVAVLFGFSLFYFGEVADDELVDLDPKKLERKERSERSPEAAKERTQNTLRSQIERQMGRAFTEEEVELKPPEIPWHAWAYSIEVRKISSEKNGQIDFFGRVVAEDGEPLAGVNLVAKIARSPDFSVKDSISGNKTNVRTVRLETDENGRFNIRSFGRRLTVTEFEKVGYLILGEREFKGMAPRKSWSYSFIANSPSSFQSDSENPEIFTMKRVE